MFASIHQRNVSDSQILMLILNQKEICKNMYMGHSMEPVHQGQPTYQPEGTMGDL